MYRAYKAQLPQESDKMAAGKLKIAVILGSVREGRLGLRVAKFIENQLRATYQIESTLLDPQEINLPLMQKALHHYKDRTLAPKNLLESESVLKAADAFIVVSAEYNHSIPPALSNFMDHFGSSLYSYKPTGIVCYSAGIYGGMRAAMQLRMFLSELGTLSVSNIFGIPKVQEALDEEGKPLSPHMESGLKKMMAQLEWHALAMKTHREKHGTP